MSTARPHLIDTLPALEALFGPVGEASLRKEVPTLHPHYQALIEASPFALLATCGPEGLDVSPRGDPAGFVEVRDEHTLLLPERRGNNRIDSLRNLVVDPRVALLFLVPGVGETLRVNGRATISVEPALLERFGVNGQPPKCVLVITVETAFFQCARAIVRSNLWHPVAADAPRRVPTPGAMLEGLTQASIDGATYDRHHVKRPKIENGSRDVTWSDADQELFLSHLEFDEDRAPRRNRDWLAWVIKLARVTGLRRGSLCSTNVEWVDLAGKCIRYPAGAMKNGEAYECPLNAEARTLVAKLLAHQQGKDRLIKPRADSMTTEFVHVRREIAKTHPHVARLRLHDLRHTWTTAVVSSQKKIDQLTLLKMSGRKSMRELARYYNPKVSDLADLLD